MSDRSGTLNIVRSKHVCHTPDTTEQLQTQLPIDFDLISFLHITKMMIIIIISVKL